jgi:hypothetical protein
MKRRLGWISLVVAIAVGAPIVATAQPVDVPPTWGGDLWSRRATHR